MIWIGLVRTNYAWNIFALMKKLFRLIKVHRQKVFKMQKCSEAAIYLHCNKVIFMSSSLFAERYRFDDASNTIQFISVFFCHANWIKMTGFTFLWLFFFLTDYQISFWIITTNSTKEEGWCSNDGGHRMSIFIWDNFCLYLGWHNLCTLININFDFLYFLMKNPIKIVFYFLFGVILSIAY